MARRASPGRHDAVADALHSAAIHLLRAVRAADTDTGLGPARLSALSVLVFAGPQRLTRLAAMEQVRPPTMTKVVAGLEGAGLARKRPDPDDARAVRIEATARGRALLLEGRQRRVARLAGGLAHLAPSDLDVLAHAAAVMERVAGRL
jgi:DNA-binding MarR family transcriptional regulator